ncbi:odorant receptor 67d-like [Contarinia nasturtii]|uniref:odorant receptor 67d-like n=1 Tax=Contarinia nasturtii TaxID=265458 RepID=UPI0012D49785|nr:odorant receptor 67d-like [Contarinia nasturtii]
MFHIRYVEDLQWVIHFIQKLYKAHIKTKSKERLAFFSNFAFGTEVFFKVITTLYILSVFTFFPYPLYMYYFENEVVTIIPVYLPGVDETQLAGYIILSCYQVLLFILATFGVLACDFFMAIIIISTLIFAKLISLDMAQINDDLLQKNSTLTVKSRLRNILLMHQEMTKYMKRVEKLTFIMFFGQIASSSIGSVIIFYVILTLHYLPVYGLLFGLLFQIFTACLLGNFVELTHDRIYKSALYINFNELSLEDQRIYRFFIKNCQKPALLTIGAMAPLNLATCVTIFSRIYSITMLIFTMVVE